jgi:hypothetical protein
MSKVARKIEPQPLLTSAEIQRIAEKIAVEMEHDADRIALITLVISHLEHCYHNSLDPWDTLYTLRKYLFVGTSEMDRAQERFQSEAFKNRGRLLLWPSEREAS